MESRRLLSGSPFSGPLQAVPGAPLSGIAGENVDGFLAELTGVKDISQLDSPKEPWPRYLIRWGDGSAPSATYTSIVADDAFGASMPMYGHIYRRPGDYVIHGAFIWEGRVLARAEQPVHVDQNSDNGVTLHAFVGQPINAVIGTYNHSGSYTIAAADVFWGDSQGRVPRRLQGPPYDFHPEWGSQSPAVLEPLGTGVYQASGTHTYLHPGEYRVRLGVYLYPPSNQGTLPPETILPSDAIIAGELPEIFSTIIVTRAAKPHAAGS